MLSWTFLKRPHLPRRLPDRMVVHVGAPKAGEKLLQNWLATNRTALGEAETGVLLPEDIRTPERFNDFQRYYRGEIDTPEVAGFTEALESTGQRLLMVSEEAFGNDLMPARWRADGGMARAERTAAFLKALPVPEIHVVLSLPRQDRFLVDTYNHMVRWAGARTEFPRWLEAQVDKEKLSWAGVVTAFDAALGQGNVTVIPADLAPRDARGFYEACLAPLGLDLAQHREPEEPPADETLGQQGLHMARALNALPISDPEHLERRRRLIDESAELLRELGDKPMALDVRLLVMEMARRYGHENARLQAERFAHIRSDFSFGTPMEPAAPRAPSAAGAV